MSDTDGCASCRLDSVACDGEFHDKVVALLHEGNSLESLLKQLITLRATHHCQLEMDCASQSRELQSLRTETAELKERIEALEASLRQTVTERDNGVEQLREANTEGRRSKREISRLEWELYWTEKHASRDLRRQAHRHNEVVNLANRPQLDVKRIHPIVLRLIFEYLVPPWVLLDRSASAGPQGRWSSAIRNLQSVALVCKTWHAAALPLLYHDVILRRVGQVIALTRTIRTSPSLFSPLVRSITLNCEVPNNCLAATRQALAYIFKQCTSLTEVSFEEGFPLPIIISDRDPPSLLPFSGKVVSLGFHNGLFPSGPFRSFAQSPLPHPLRNLVSLTIDVWCIYFNLPIEANFPHLEVLTLCVPEGSYAGFHMPSDWILPTLKTLRFRPSVEYPQAFPAIDKFCELHGEKLLCLDFGRNPLEQSVPSSVINEQLQTVRLCPRLEHLVMRIHDGSDADVLRSSDFFNRPMDLVDLVHRNYGDLYKVPREDMTRYHRGSAWKVVRQFDTRVLAWAPELPYLFSPLQTQKSSDNRQVHHFDGLDVIESNGEIYFDDDLWSIWPDGSAGVGGTVLGGLEMDDSDGSDYESFTGSAHRSEGDGSDLSVVASDDNSATVEVQLTETEILDVYRNTLGLNDTSTLRL